MESSIIFLGTGGDSTVVGKQIRGSGGIVIVVDGYQFHLDPGPGSIVRSRQFNINPRNNTAIFSSNNHINHAGGLNELIYAMTHEGLDKKGVVIANHTVINGTEEEDSLLNKKFKNSVERYIALNPGQKVGINSIEVRAIKAFNDDPNAIGFKFYTPKFILSYSSLTKYDDKLIEEYENSNILILNTQEPEESDTNKSLSMEDAKKLINAVKPKLCILTYFGVKFLNADPLYESRELQKETGVEILVAKDGMIVNPVDYSTSLIQKTLNLYPPSK